jgi:hypothetical protein
MASSPKRRVTVGLVVIAVMVASAIFILTRPTRPPSQRPRTGEAATVSPPDRDDAAIALLNGDLAVFGGYATPSPGLLSGPLNDGALYDTATRLWRPFRGPAIYPALGDPAAVAVMKELVVLGVQCFGTEPGEFDPEVRECAPARFAAASYDPSDNAWTSIDVPDELPTFELPYLLAPQAIGGHASRAYFRYSKGLVAIDLENRQVIQLPAMPFGAEKVCVTPNGLTAVSVVIRRLSKSDVKTPSSGRTIAVTASTLPHGGSRWSAATTFESSRPAPRTASAFCAGDAVVVVPSRVDGFGGATNAFVLQRSEWREITGPAINVGVLPPNVWTGAELVLWANRGYGNDGQAVAYAVAENAWRPLASPPLRSALVFWDDGRALVLQDDARQPVVEVTLS